MIRYKPLKTISVFLIMAISLSFISGCSASKDNLAKESQQIIRYNLKSEPKNVDPAFALEIEQNTVIANAFEGLLKLDKNQNPTYGVAERYEVSKDGLKYTFHLRKDALWWDGRKVTAEDFNYAWRRVLNPDTASPLASKLFCIKNGEAYNSRKMTSDNLGLKVIDSRTLEITLESIVTYFPSIVASPICSPVRRDVVLKNPEVWAKKPETFICNGPFKMEQWKSTSNISFVKNDRYWDKKNIKLSRVEYKLIQEPAAYFSAFNTGELDFISNPPTSEIPNLIKNSAVKVYPYLGVNCLLINISDNVSKLDTRVVAALKDVKVRQALSLAINRQDIYSNMTTGVKTPAVAFVPKGIPEYNTESDFKINGYIKEEGDVIEAKKLLEEAGYPGGKGFPTLTYNYETNEDSKNVAEVIQNMWKKNLGINIKLKSTESKVFTKNITSKGYILSNRSFIGEYVDPMAFLDTWSVANKNNYVNYNNSNYDVKIDAAKKELDQKKRMKLLHESEDILMADIPVIPLYFYTNLGCGKEYVKNVQVTSLGIVLFDKAYISLKQ